MALRRDRLYGINMKNGELDLKSGIAVPTDTGYYFGGHPIMVGASGVVLADDVTKVDYIAANCAYTDHKYGDKVTGYFLPCVLVLYSGDDGVYGYNVPPTYEGFPYDNTLAWVKGDKVYWNTTTNQWQRTPATSGDPAYGTVEEVGPSNAFLRIHFHK